MNLKDTIEGFREIIKDAEKLHKGNITHQKDFIIGTAKWYLNEIAKQTESYNVDKPKVKIFYSWLRPDGEYSQEKYLSIEEITETERQEAKNNGWKLMKLKEIFD